MACLRDHAVDHAGKPFFHLVAFTAPHFPLQAPPDLIAKYRERYGNVGYAENVLYPGIPEVLARLSSTGVTMGVCTTKKVDFAEQILAMKRDNRLCHGVGSYCSSRLPIIRVCIETTESYCCFNSRLARILNEQGRAQLGRGWGGPQNPDCGGFTVTQLQSLDFSRMNLTEFYAEIAPTLPDVGAPGTAPG